MLVPTNFNSQALSKSDNAIAFAVHRCRFVDYSPSAITSVAFPPLALPTSSNSKSGKSRRKRKGRFGPLAIGRSNGNIELYEWAIPPDQQEHSPKAPQAWVLSKVLYGPNPSKVDSIVFILRYPHLLAYNEVPTLADLRLFSAGGGSELVEWNIVSGTILRTLNSQGGAIWCMAANPTSTQLALGCEDGRVRLVDVSNGEMSHLRRFDRAKCRILSIAWGPPVPPTPSRSGDNEEEDETSSEDEDDEWIDSWLVTGGSDSSLRKWDVKTGRILDRMSTDKARGERTLVWAVGVLADGTIVSGDSLGIVKFWDSRTCTQLHSFSAHGADVLCIAINPDGQSVFTSGVDQKVCLFTHVKVSDTDKAGKNFSGHKSKARWVQSTSKRMHSHDVRALAVWPPYLPISSSARPSHPSPFSGISPILASGGLDASLVLAPCATAGTSGQQLINPLATSAISTFEDSYHRRLAYPTGLQPAVTVARTARLLLCRRDTSLSIWRIIGRACIHSALEVDLRAAEAMDVDIPHDIVVGNNQQNEDESGYEKLLDMELDAMTNLCSSAISDDGRWLAVSDAYEVKLFELLADTEGGRIKPRRVKPFMAVLSAYISLNAPSSKEPEGASALGFTPDEGRLVIALSRSAHVLVVDLTGRSADGRPEPRVLRRFEHHARRKALFAGGRIVKDIPERANGIAHVNGTADSDNSDDTTDISNAEMDNWGSVDKNGKSEEDDEDEEEHASIIRMAFSPDGQWFATTDDHYRAHIFNLDAVQHHAVLPTSPALVTALAFSPSPSSVSSTSASSGSTLLILAHADSTIGVFDVEARRFAPWASHLAQLEHLPRRWTSLHDSVLGIAIEPRGSSSSTTSSVGSSEDDARHALFWGATWLCRVSLDAPVGWGDFAKKRRRDGSSQKLSSKSKGKSKTKTGSSAGANRAPVVVAEGGEVDAGSESEEESMSNFKLVTRYRPILRVDFLDAGELLVVERPLLDVLRNLPPAFFKPKYGT
ncbi:UTP4 [Sanghuangporus weigelae]